jgi:hypothetical protein
MNQIDEALSQFKSDDVTSRLCTTMFSAIPFAPRQAEYTTLDEATTALFPQATAAVRQRAQQLAGEANVKSALWMFNALDMGDTGIAIYSGLRTALGLFKKEGADAFETDTQQGIDSALKLLGISYAVVKLFPQGNKITSYHACPAGQALTFYWAAVEVALPFADNVIQGGAGFAQQLVQKYGGGAKEKLGGAAEATVAEAAPAVQELLGPVDNIVAQVGPHAKKIAEQIQGHLPGVSNATDKVAGAVATAADALPVYRLLGARLCAESVVLRASRGE